MYVTLRLCRLASANQIGNLLTKRVRFFFGARFGDHANDGLSVATAQMQPPVVPFETQAIRRVFGSAADCVAVSSTKSMHAHCMGASAALEMIACVMAIREGIIPPTIGYRERDPECDLDVTPNVARARPVRVALSNAFAFGGTNAVVAFSAA